MRETPEENIKVKWGLDDSLKKQPRFKMHVTWNRKAHLNNQSLWMWSATCTAPESLRNKPGTVHGKQRTILCSHRLYRSLLMPQATWEKLLPHCDSHLPGLTCQVLCSWTLAQRFRNLPKDSKRDSQFFLWILHSNRVHPPIQGIWAVRVALASFSNYLTSRLNSSLPLFLQLFHYFNNKFIEWAWFTFIIRGKLFYKENINTAILFLLVLTCILTPSTNI